jgi:dihydroorotate dehydrogenase (NAD+) catalytic subunit
MTQTYDIYQTYQYNYDRGPVFASEPKPLQQGPMQEFLGLKVRSRIGIAAGVLLNSKWIIGYARRGFDILSYKTVRSSHRPCYPLPNWVFVDDPTGDDGPVYVNEKPKGDPRQLSSAVCFGMPSMSPEVWREDVRRAKTGLGEGQILIVSVVATPSEKPNQSEVADDFGRCAQWAAEAGADVIEANFSCPNVCSAEGSIYTDPNFSRAITQTIRDRIGSKPLLIKVGHYKAIELMRRFLLAVNGIANGVTLVNAISRPVLYRDGRPAFGPKYMRAGVLGRAIHAPCVQSVREAASIIRENNLQLSIAAVGGVSQAQDARDFFEAGADAIMLGSSPMYLPDIAGELRY